MSGDRAMRLAIATAAYGLGRYASASFPEWIVRVWESDGDVQLTVFDHAGRGRVELAGLRDDVFSRWSRIRKVLDIGPRVGDVFGAVETCVRALVASRAALVAAGQGISAAIAAERGAA